VKVMANHHAGEVLVHLGSSNYLERYKIYVTHLQEWQQQFGQTGIGGLALRPADHRQSRFAGTREAAAAFHRSR